MQFVVSVGRSSRTPRPAAPFSIHSEGANKRGELGREVRARQGGASQRVWAVAKVLIRNYYSIFMALFPILATFLLFCVSSFFLIGSGPKKVFY